MKSGLLFFIVFFYWFVLQNNQLAGQSLAERPLNKIDNIHIDSLQQQLIALEKNQTIHEKHLQQYQQSQILWVLAMIAVLSLMGYLFYKYLSLKNKYKKISEDLSHQKIRYEVISTEKQNLDALYENQEDLMRGVAHDLKAPLNRIYGLVDVIFLQADNLNKEQHKYLGLIQRVANEARNMIQNWLDVKAIESQNLQINMAEIDLKQLLDDMITSYQETAQKKSIQIDYHLQKKQLLYTTDSNLLSRILDNLLSNAVKFSPLNEIIKFSVLEQGENIIFEIEDHGVGISEQEKGKLFQKFQTLSARPTAGESSTGLGLSIVKTLTTHLKGEIEVESVVGEGSTFRVILPKNYSPEQLKEVNVLEEDM